MRQAIHIFALIIIINLLLCLTLILYINQNEEINYINYDKANKYEINYNTTSMQDIFLFNYETSNVTIAYDGSYNVNMFIKNFDSYNKITFEILNNETYTAPGTYKIMILGKYEKNIVIKEAILIIEEKPVEQYYYYTPVYDSPIVAAPLPKKTTPVPVNTEANNNSNNNNTNNQGNDEPNNTPPGETTPTEPIVPPEPVILGTYDDTIAYQVFALVNEARRNAGISELVWNETLVANAKTRVYEASVSFSHTRPDGTGFYTAITVNYTAVGENIAGGFTTSNSVFEGWMNSESHKNNILDEEYNQIGIATYIENGYYYWTQEFAG